MRHALAGGTLGRVLLLLLAHAAATCALAGLVWVVQLVVYPAFLVVGPTPAWAAYHRAHSAAITRAVVLPWAVQGLCDAAFLLRPSPLRLAAAALGAASVALTVGVQVPLHTRLGKGWDEAAARRLLASNWLRVGVWTAAAAVGLVLVGQAAV